LVFEGLSLFRSRQISSTGKDLTMHINSNIVFPILLISLFVVVGIHLLLYSKKRHLLINEFAKKNGLELLPVEHSVRLEEELNSSLSLDGNGAVRKVMKLKDLVAGQGITIFRCIELLKFGPTPSNTPHHQNHVASTFIVPEKINLFFSINQAGEFRPWYPRDYPLKEDPYFQKLIPVLNGIRPPREVTITLRNERGFIYNNPLVTGGEKMDDLDYLYQLSIKIKQLFS